MTRKRLYSVLLVLGIVVLISVVSWTIGANIQSPAEVAARTAPPTPSPILVPVELRELTADIVTRGTARFGLPQAVGLVPSVLKSEISVVTTLPTRNTQVQEGDVLLTASGRPVFVLQGETPVYRDFSPGVSGVDIRQLEEGIARLGFDPGPIDGVFDELTSAGIAAWYEASGWQPFGATAQQIEAVRSLEQLLTQTTNEHEDASAAVLTAALAVEATRASAESANLVAAATAEASATADLKLAQARTVAVELEGQVLVQSALDTLHQAERAQKASSAVISQLSTDLENARRLAVVQLPSDEIVFIAQTPVRVEQIEVIVGDAARGPVLTVTNNQLAIDSSLPLDEAPLVQPGMAVAIDEQDLGIKSSGVVARVASGPGTDGADNYHVYFETLVEETDAKLEGFSLRLTIPVKSTGGEVLIVPISALTLAADGTSRVQVEIDGALEFITVEPGLSTDGFVEVLSPNRILEAGHLVVIGFD